MDNFSDNQNAIAWGGGNYSATVLEQREDRVMDKVMDKVSDEVETSEYVFGHDINGGFGYSSFKKALEVVKSFKSPPYQSLWIVEGKKYILVKILNKPVFDFYNREE